MLRIEIIKLYAYNVIRISSVEEIVSLCLYDNGDVKKWSMLNI